MRGLYLSGSSVRHEPEVKTPLRILLTKVGTWQPKPGPDDRLRVQQGQAVLFRPPARPPAALLYFEARRSTLEARSGTVRRRLEAFPPWPTYIYIHFPAPLFIASGAPISPLWTRATNAKRAQETLGGKRCARMNKAGGVGVGQDESLHSGARRIRRQRRSRWCRDG